MSYKSDCSQVQDLLLLALFHALLSMAAVVQYELNLYICVAAAVH